jgi:hypothetical protein
MHKSARAAAALVATSLATIANAAPFCVVTGAGKQCFYFDAPTCQRIAAASSGACVTNDEEVRAPAGSSAPFCVVASYGTQCIYYNFASCENAARAVRGTCAAR